MFEKREAERRTRINRRRCSDRRISDREETEEWLPPYGRRKLDMSDRRYGERRLLCRRKVDSL